MLVSLATIVPHSHSSIQLNNCYNIALYSIHTPALIRAYLPCGTIPILMISYRLFNQYDRSSEGWILYNTQGIRIHIPSLEYHL